LGGAASSAVVPLPQQSRFAPEFAGQQLPVSPSWLQSGLLAHVCPAAALFTESNSIARHLVCHAIAMLDGGLGFVLCRFDL